MHTCQNYSRVCGNYTRVCGNYTLRVKSHSAGGNCILRVKITLVRVEIRLCVKKYHSACRSHTLPCRNRLLKSHYTCENQTMHVNITYNCWTFFLIKVIRTHKPSHKLKYQITFWKMKNSNDFLFSWKIKCDYDTHDCDLNTHKSNFCTQSVIFTRMSRDCSAVYLVYYLHYTLTNTPSVTTV
jgi:hypothetical protein